MLVESSGDSFDDLRLPLDSVVDSVVDSIADSFADSIEHVVDSLVGSFAMSFHVAVVRIPRIVDTAIPGGANPVRSAYDMHG